MKKTFRKIAILALAATIAPTMIFANGSQEEMTSSDNGKSGTITVLVEAMEAEGLKAVMKDYQKINPNVKLETIIATDTENKDTVLTAKIASNDLPDMICTQVKSNIGEYAKNGYIIPLTDTGIQDRLIKGDQSLLWRGDDFYAVPTQFSTSGIYVNFDVLKEYGVEMNEMPQCLGDFVAVCAKLQKAGLESPIAISAKESGPVTAFVFQYVYQNVYGQNPNWYADVLRGKDGWNGELFKSTYQAYGQLLPFVNKDALGCDKNSAIKKIVLGEAAFYIDTSAQTTSLRNLAPDMDLVFIAPPFATDAKDMKAIVSFDNAYAITSQATDVELCKDFLLFLTTAEESAVYATATQFMPTITGTKVNLDPALDHIISVISSGMDTVPMLSRQWIPGIKSIMKKGTQDWFAGKDYVEVCDNIDNEHQRLMKANPSYVEDFLANYTDL